jgi:hypothetical protein
MSNFLTELKHSLKQSLALNLEAGLELLHKSLSDKHSLTNELFMLQGRFHTIESQNRKGILSTENYLLEINKLRAGAMDMVDQLEAAAIDPGFSEEARRFVESTSPVTTPQPAVTAPGDSVSLTDLEEFSLQHRETLKAFPRIYRDVRSKVIRKDPNDPEIAFILNNLRQHLPILNAFASDMDPIKGYWRQIVLKADDLLQLELKQLRAVQAELEITTMASLNDHMEPLRKARQELQQRSILPT